MPRPRRPDIPGYPQHIVQRGHNRLPCFLDDLDRRRYLVLLGEGLLRYECALHAYVLMDNHTHLLITPTCTGAVSRLMQTFGRNFVGWFNHRHRRTGTLWEGRFHGSLVDNDSYLLACHRYIEMNPVRAGMVADPIEHRWSSHRGNTMVESDPILTPHPRYIALHQEPSERARRYRLLFDEPLNDKMLDQIRRFSRQRGALGGEAFRRRAAETLRRFVGARPAHRPKASAPGEDNA
jgi:putative transposase